MNAIETIKRLAHERNTLVCAGIDPNLERMPHEIRALDASDEEKVERFVKAYVDIVAPHVCAFKAQKAYFDVFDGGHALLREIIRHVHVVHGVPVIVDCKIGDIDETMNAYLRNLFELLDADGVVVNPYMGDDVMQPLAAHADKVIVPLVKTSNPGGSIVQDMKTTSGKYVWEEILELVMNRWNAAGNMAPVIASTQNVDLSAVRKTVGDDAIVFFAGMGAQGGSMQDLTHLLNKRGMGVLINSSRGLMYPAAENGEDWRQAIVRAVTDLQMQVNAARS